MDLMVYAGYSNEDRYEEWKNNLVVYIEKCVGLPEAIDFAERNVAEQLLCKLVYNGGKKYYEVLYRCISAWRPAFLNVALETIFGQEKLKIIDAQAKTQQIVTLNKQAYSGFQMFDIFEQRYLL